MPSIKSRNWTKQEDEQLTEIVNEIEQKSGLKPTWNQISDILREKNSQSNKSGKQCRQRWINHLNPEVKKNMTWTSQQNKKLFTKHQQLGNKWSQIASHLPGRTDNCIKNHFYSTLRRGMRKINHYIQNVKRKEVLVKTFKNEILNKILLLSQTEGRYDSKFQFTAKAKELAVQIKKILINLAAEQEDTQDNSKQKSIEQKGDNLLQAKGFEMICQFSRNCKKRKTKKYVSNEVNKNQQSEMVEQSIDDDISNKKNNRKFKAKIEQSESEQPKQMKSKKQTLTVLKQEHIFEQIPIKRIKNVQIIQNNENKNAQKAQAKSEDVVLNKSQSFQKPDFSNTNNQSILTNSLVYENNPVGKNIHENQDNNWLAASNVQSKQKLNKLLNQAPIQGKDSGTSLFHWSQKFKGSQMQQCMNMNMQVFNLGDQGMIKFANEYPMPQESNKKTNFVLCDKNKSQTVDDGQQVQLPSSPAIFDAYQFRKGSGFMQSMAHFNFSENPCIVYQYSNSKFEVPKDDDKNEKFNSGFQPLSK